MLELRWSELARTDLLAIVDYISDDNVDAAQRVKDDIEAKAEKLKDFPKMGRPGRVKETRELVVWANYLIVCISGKCFFSTNIARITCSTAMASLPLS